MRTTTRRTRKRTTKGRKPAKVKIPEVERPPTDPLALVPLVRKAPADDDADLAYDVGVLEAAASKHALCWETIASYVRHGHFSLTRGSFEERVARWKPCIVDGKDLGPPKPTREWHDEQVRSGRSGLAQLRGWLGRAGLAPDEVERLLAAVLRVSYRVCDLETLTNDRTGELLQRGRVDGQAMPAACDLVRDLRAERGEAQAIGRALLAARSTGGVA